MEKILTKIQHYTVYTLVVLLPLVVLPVSPNNPFVVSKITLLAFCVGVLLIVWVVKIIYEGSLKFYIGNYDLPVVLLAVSYITSTILITPNKMEAILLPGTASIVILCTLLYFIINQLSTPIKEKLPLLLTISAGIYSAISLLSAVGVFAKIPQLPAYFQSTSFSPEGGYLPSVIMFVLIIPLALGELISKKQAATKVIVSISLTLMVFGLGLFIFNMLPGKPANPRFASFSTYWSVAVDSLKDNPFLGVGPGNYLTAFNRFRPREYSLTNLWAVKFTTARSYYLTVLTESGIVGFVALVLIAWIFYKTARKDFKEKSVVKWGFAGIAHLVSLGLALFLFVFFPASLSLVFILFILLAANAKTSKTTLNLTTKEADETKDLSQRAVSKFPAILLTTPVVIIVIFAFVKGTKIFAAEYRYNQAVNSLAANNAQKTYNNLVSAIQLNNRVDRYHSTLSQVDLIFTNNLLQKEDLGDTDRNTIAQLVQQAIAEAKAAVALNPLRAGNWYLLGATYQSIIPLAKGADAFAVQSFSQAVALDPYNTNIRIALGGIYYAAKDYDTASRVFELAVQTKPDHANAHYNLAYAYKELGKTDLAIQQMTAVLSLLDTQSKDYETAKQVLEELQNTQKAQAAQGEELVPPQEAQEPVIEPQIDLPEESEPPQTPLSPTPTPSPEPTEVEIGNETPTVTTTPNPTVTP